MAGRVAVDLPSQNTDGSAANWPQGGYYHVPEDRLYHEKLANNGKELIPGAKPMNDADQKYIYRELPEGYRIYHKARDDGRIDRYIFGHPRGKFDSPAKFLFHFRWLMQGGVGPCGCVNCKSPMRATSLLSTTPVPRFPDPDANDLHAQLERFTNYFDENMNEMSEQSVAWEGLPPWSLHQLLDGQSFKDVAAKYLTLPSFLPRKGELVLFYLTENCDCRFEETTQYFKIFDKISGQFLEFPTWRAGVIAAEPAEQLGHGDLSALPSDSPELINKSFRIELYPDPESRDKSFSSDIEVVPLSCIRPLSAFHEFLSGIPQMDWHVTIHSALKLTNTACLVDPIEFVGEWFSYSIRCRGIWIGAELYVTGDAVRLFPAKENDAKVDQVMIISRIEHRFENDDVHDERSSVIIAGPVITTNKNRSSKEAPFTSTEKQELLLPASTAGYDWYPSDISQSGSPTEPNYEGFFNDWQEVPISYIVGRLYDSEAMKTVFNISNFDVGGLGMKQAKHWAKKHRTNLRVSIHQDWTLTVDRIQALNIVTLNGRAVGTRAERAGLRGNRRPGMDSSQTYGDKGLLAGGSSSDTNNDVQSDANGHRAKSPKSVVTDRTHNWSEDEEDLNAETFISEMIAGILVPAEEGETDGSVVDGAENGESLERERPTKRPRV